MLLCYCFSGKRDGVSCGNSLPWQVFTANDIFFFCFFIFLIRRRENYFLSAVTSDIYFKYPEQKPETVINDTFITLFL